MGHSYRLAIGTVDALILVLEARTISIVDCRL